MQPREALPARARASAGARPSARNNAASQEPRTQAGDRWLGATGHGLPAWACESGRCFLRGRGRLLAHGRLPGA
eukprot:4602222-Alexandrium_andersonii.AAC.1